MEFQGKTVLITGASRGIGRSLALAFGQHKAKVVVNFLKSSREADEVVQQIRKMKGTAIKVKADVSKRGDVERLVKRTLKEFNKIDILINNAGIVSDKPYWQEISEKDCEMTIVVNLKSVFECSRLVGKLMLKQKRGRIINISSLRGILGASDIVVYGAAKAGVINLTKSFAKALAPNVNVSCLCLGGMNIGMSKTAEVDKVKKGPKKTLSKRTGKVEDIVNAILFLASEKSGFITGQTLIVDGGASLRE